jgi:selT/selW/selH-like putative selenoprotein
MREVAFQRIKLGDNIVIKQMEAPAYFEKVSKDVKETKYFDIRKEEEVYFPRLGAFEVYVDKVLIFSKLKSNLWPNI